MPNNIMLAVLLLASCLLLEVQSISLAKAGHKAARKHAVATHAHTHTHTQTQSRTQSQLHTQTQTQTQTQTEAELIEPDYVAQLPKPVAEAKPKALSTRERLKNFIEVAEFAPESAFKDQGGELILLQTSQLEIERPSGVAMVEAEVVENWDRLNSQLLPGERVAGEIRTAVLNSRAGGKNNAKTASKPSSSSSSSSSSVPASPPSSISAQHGHSALSLVESDSKLTSVSADDFRFAHAAVKAAGKGRTGASPTDWGSMAYLTPAVMAQNAGMYGGGMGMGMALPGGPEFDADPSLSMGFDPNTLGGIGVYDPSVLLSPNLPFGAPQPDGPGSMVGGVLTPLPPPRPDHLPPPPYMQPLFTESTAQGAAAGGKGAAAPAAGAPAPAPAPA